MNDDIIAAVATSRLEAAISIIRVSGKDCTVLLLRQSDKQEIQYHQLWLYYGW